MPVGDGVGAGRHCSDGTRRSEGGRSRPWPGHSPYANESGRVSLLQCTSLSRMLKTLRFHDELALGSDKPHEPIRHSVTGLENLVH